MRTTCTDTAATPKTKKLDVLGHGVRMQCIWELGELSGLETSSLDPNFSTSVESMRTYLLPCAGPYHSRPPTVAS